MILTCPDCATQYPVKDGAIGPNGRTVRCSKCNATWFVAADADVLSLHEAQQEQIEAVSKGAHIQRTRQAPPVQKRQSDNKIDSDNYDDVPRVRRGADAAMRDKVERNRRNRRLLGVSMIWVVTLGILLAAAILGYFFRHEIVNKWPGTASIYKGFDVPVSETGLVFEDPVTRNIMVDGKPVLVINGMIENVTSNTISVPLIELSLLGSSKESITSWYVDPPQKTIGPRGRLEYKAQYPQPPVDAVSLEYRFATDPNAQAVPPMPEISDTDTPDAELSAGDE